MDSSFGTTTTPTTIGMQLDEWIAKLDSMSTTQLYGLIVVATVILCFVLLGSGDSAAAAADNMALLEKIEKPRRRSSSSEPRWHIFRWVNYAIMAAFAWSVAHFGLNATSYLNDLTVLQFLLGWSLFLCYFFGFFGISFVHDIAKEEEEYAAPTLSSSSSSIGSSPSRNNSPSRHSTAYTAPSCSAASLSPCGLPKEPTSSSSTKDIKHLDDHDIAQLVLTHKLKDHELEKRLDPFRAVEVRRLVAHAQWSKTCNSKKNPLDRLPFAPSLDYGRVHGANCESVVGYIPLPVGVVGPMRINGEMVYIPMATTEGCLVASTNRGAKAITQGGEGAHAVIVRDGMTRAPCVRMESAREAAKLVNWCQEPDNIAALKAAFSSTTSFGKLQSCTPTIAGRNVYLRLVCASGDAMGMNMVSKGSLAVIETLRKNFPSLQLVALSGNMCTDKKAAATNWLQGRGKSVVVEATIPKQVVRTTLKTTVQAMVHTNLHKNLIGSAMAGALGGFNAHASNIVTAVFLATGQDPAQNVESSNCITLMEETPQGDLWISCTMPSLEVGTIGGGTSLEAQAACLELLHCRGGHATQPGLNAQKLAMIVASATMAGELSLLAALAANTLVQAHMAHNRKK